MRSISTFSFFLFISALLPSLSSAKNHEDVSFISKRKTTRDLNTCKSIASKVSKSSSVFFEGSPEYVQYLTHYMSSSSQNSTCVFLPTDPKDISIAIKIIGQNKSPFAVSSGSHASNPKQSSTKGVHISMKGFQGVKLSKDKTSVDIGSGNVWDNVYQALEGSGVNVVGARASGVGVGGFILGGGGYSFKTDQFGLTVDTLISADMVLPDGSLKTVTSADKDLFFAIKGGGNRFGLVYNFKLKTVPQTGMVWGGPRMYFQDQFSSALQAIKSFVDTNQDPKASILPTFNFAAGMPILVLIAFYDGPSPPAGVFDVFNNATALTDDWNSKSYYDVVRSVPSNTTAGTRGAFHTVSLKEFSMPVLSQIVNQTMFHGAQDASQGAVLTSIAVEPFQKYGQFSKGGAYGHSKSQSPLHFYFAWTDAAQDDYFKSAIKSAASIVKGVAEGEGQELDDLSLYPNYALSNTSPKALYGKKNADRLEKIRKQVDPNDVMLQAGYFKFTY